MVEENTSVAASAAPTPIAAPEAAPAAASVSPTPEVSNASPAPAQAAPEASAPAPSQESASTTLLGDEPKPTEAPKPAEEPKPADGDKPADAPKDESSQSDTPAPLPSYEPWTLPEGVTLDEAKTTEFNTLLAEFQTNSKAEKTAVQALGQELVNRHIAGVQEAVERVHETYRTAVQRQTEDWKQAFINDPEIGGNRQQTTVAAANEFISTFGGTPEQQKELRQLFNDTGLGNHPAFIRTFANAKNSAQFSPPKPVVGQPAAPKVSRSEKFYGKKTG